MPVLKSFRVEARSNLLLALPIIAGNVSHMLLGLADTVMIGRLGVTQLAASAFANSLLMVPLIFGFGFLQCITVLVSQSGDAPGSSRLLRNLMLLVAVGGTALGFLFIPLSGFLGVFSQPPEVTAAAVDYLIIVGWSILPVMLASSIKNFAEARDHPWQPMFILLGGVLLNIFLNWVLIYGNLGAPAMGLEGAAWATLISRISTLAGMVWWGFQKHELTLEPKAWKGPVFEKNGYAPLLRIGLPSGIQLLMEVGAFSAAAVMAGWISSSALAAHQIAITCASMTFMLPLGVANAATIRIGQALGGGQIKKLRAAFFTAQVMGSCMMLSSAAVFLLFGDWIASQFVDDAGVVMLTAQLLIVAGIFQIFDGLQVVASGSLRGLSDVNVPMALIAGCYWGIGLPLAWYLAFARELGVTGIWLGLAIALALASMALNARFLAKSSLRAAHG